MRVALAVVVIAAGLGVAAGCDSGSDSTTTDEAVECDEAAIGAAVEAAVEEQEPSANVDPPYDVGCADGWAYAIAEVATGDQQVAVTFVFDGSSGEWELQDRAAVCRAPSDQVPSAIYEKACASSGTTSS